MNGTLIDPNDMPDERENYRYSLEIETPSGTITRWRSDDYEETVGFGEVYEQMLKEKGRVFPWSVIDHFAHLKDEN